MTAADSDGGVAIVQPHTTIWAYLWDLCDDGLDAAVSRCRDELGLDGISVATAYHSHQQLRPRASVGRLRVASRAALYFHPDPLLWRGLPVDPVVDIPAAGGNPLADLAAVCARRGVDLTAWTVCLHNSHLAARHPHLAERNVFGDSLHWSLCPAEETVQAYVLALCTDLARNYGIRRLELESCGFGGYGHAHYHLKDGVPLGALGSYLLGLCFSPACVARARERGIDVDGLQAWVQARLQTALASGEPLAQDVAEAVAAHPQLAAYQRWREQLVESLVAQVRQRAGVEVSVILMGDRWHTGAAPAAMARAADLVEILAYTADSRQVAAQVHGTVAAGVAASRLVLGLQCYPPCATRAADLIAAADSGAKLGVSRFSFYNYGIAPPACLRWVEATVGRLTAST